MPVEIIELHGFEGPNLHGPQPLVWLRVRAPDDVSEAIRTLLKESGQRVGMVIGYLEIETTIHTDTHQIDVSFVTPTPGIGSELARYVVEHLNAQTTQDDTWDEEEPLWQLQQRRRREALSIQALQVIAEASQRGVPSFLRADGNLQIGYGARGYILEIPQTKQRTSGTSLSLDDIGIGAPASAQALQTVAVPWEQIGSIPVIAISGATAHTGTAQMVAEALRAKGEQAGFSDSADFATIRMILSEPTLTSAVIGLDLHDLAQHGLAFTRCAYSAIVNLSAPTAPALTDTPALARVAGIPMLVTERTGYTVLNADIPEIVALAEYAPCPVIYISATSTNPMLHVHRVHGGTAVFVRDGEIIVARGNTEQRLAAGSLPESQIHDALAALALAWLWGDGERVRL